MQQKLDGSEQGFTEQPPTEIIQIQPIKIISYHPYTPKIYTHPLKLIIPHKQFIKQQYINQQLQNQLRHKFQANQSNVIYNCHIKNSESKGENMFFDSNFESGNLEYVIDRGNNCYWLYIKSDSNTKGHFQWFYFKVKSKKVQSCTFVIKNFMKGNLYYRNGLKPFYRSTLRGMNNYQQIASEVSFDWTQAQEQNSEQFYQLQYQFIFQKKNQEVQFCSQPPYTYTHLNQMLKTNTHTKVHIANTILGHSIYALVINENIQTKALVVAFARQHPGQTVGSWMMEGFIKKIAEIPNNCTWIIIPMVNIDGVIVGNNRSGILGYDFNRSWHLEQDSQKSLYPQIAGIIKYIKGKKNAYKRKTKIFLDFHGHSSEANVFAYGSPYPKQSKYYNLSRLFPYLINKKNADFSYNQCSYQIQSNKKNCARAVFLNRLGFPLSYTIESSFGIYQNREINEIDVMKIGEDICETTIEYLKLLTNNISLLQCNRVKQLISIMKQQITQKEGEATYNSDSDNEDQNDPIRLKFVNKIQQMLKSNNVASRNTILNFLKGNKSTPKRFRQFQYSGSIRRQSQKSNNTEIKHHKIKISRQRLRTEQLRAGNRTPNRHNTNIILPKINQSIKNPSPPRKNNILISDLHLDILTLTEIKQKLFSMKKSKLGRRFLILQ